MDPMRITYPSLEHVARNAGPFPTSLVVGCESALVLFAAGFLGHNDAIHFAEAGIPDVTLVDNNAPRLEEMRSLYRDVSWEWVAGDAWEVAGAARAVGRLWDAVTVDTFTGDAEARSLAGLELWTSLASRFVAVGASLDAEYRVPDGWSADLIPRSSHVQWLVLQPSELL